jgi:hypothetical protein
MDFLTFSLDDGRIQIRTVTVMTYLDPGSGSPKTYRSYGSESTTLLRAYLNGQMWNSSVVSGPPTPGSILDGSP